MIKKLAFLSLPLLIAAGLIVIWFGAASAQRLVAFSYLSPTPGAKLVSAGTTIAVRHGEYLLAESLDSDLFEVVGSKSGLHVGNVVLSDDGKTAIFYPQQPFAPGEKVAVHIQPGLRTQSGLDLEATTFEFQISPKLPGLPSRQSTQEWLKAFPELSQQVPNAGQASDSSNSPVTYTAKSFATLPDTFPAITVTVPASGTAEGYLFLSNFLTYPTFLNSKGYLLILDDQGEPVYAGQMAEGWPYIDFKKQPDGTLTYYDIPLGGFKALDSSYTLTDTYKAGNGYRADFHELLVLPDGHVLLMIYDEQTVDMSQIVAGGVPTATVLGLVVQEIDTQDNVVFEWRSWDHIPITSTYEDVTADRIDYVHGNAIEVDDDGNLLISSRHLSEITKIDRNTGEILWHLGGKSNQFTFTNMERPFSYQHDIRRWPNEHITVFDNGNHNDPQYSRALEFSLDELKKTATLVWDYRNTPDTYARAMGSARRQPNGNTLIGWGSANPTLTEVTPQGSKAFELTFEPYESSYRAFRFPWQGFPGWAPAAVAVRKDGPSRLVYSWNGATEIASYKVYGGKTAANVNTLLYERPRTGFETESDLSAYLNDYCYYRVMPVDKQGQETQYSNVVFAFDSVCNQNTYLPVTMR
jgi:hypothetical protein